MGQRQKLSDEQLRARLATLEGWQFDGAKLSRSFRFADFADAFAFMAKMAAVSERKNHHPDWSNVYNSVSVNLSTHDAGGVTELDLEWAQVANATYRKLAQG